MIERRSGEDRRSAPREQPERRKRGRPPAIIPGERLSIWMPITDLDRMIRLAAAEDMSVSALGYEAVRKYLLEKSQS